MRGQGRAGVAAISDSAGRFFRNSRGGPGVALFLALGAAFVFLALSRWGSPASAAAAGPEAAPTAQAMADVHDRLAPPVMPPHPTQADLGAEVYYKVCMACHGDRGQGLAPEFRALLGPQDENCWQSKCHAANHMPGGFVFPKVVPAVITPTMAAQFPTALALYDFIQTKMPYNNPGGLKDDEYWQLTAFLVRANGGGPLPALLDSRNAAGVALKPSAPRATSWLIGIGAVAAVLAGLAAWWSWRRSRR